MTEKKGGGQHREALAAAWDDFRAWPSVEKGRRVLEHAGALGQRPEWAEKVLSMLQERTNLERKPLEELLEEGASLRVGFLLWTGEVEEAWKRAQEGGCSDRLWLELAARREATDPDAALAVYFQLAEKRLSEPRDEACEEALELLRKAGALLSRLGRDQEFVASLEALRRKQQQNPGFLRRLDGAKLI